MVKYLDVKLAEFLENLDKKYYLKDTAIFLFCDHGNSMIGIYNIHDALLDSLWYHLNNKIFWRKGQSIYKEINDL